MRSAERRLHDFAILAVLVMLGISCCGCQFAPKKMPSVWPWDKEEPKELPDRILAVWSDTVLHQKGLPGVRGFGGRIYFYKKDSTDPIEIDGGLAVYVFDADDLSPASQQPLRKFVFTPDQFESHMSKTSIGPSYSVWIPMSEVGGPQMRLSLIARFEGRDGGSTISDPTIKLLPGIPKQESLAKTMLQPKKSGSHSPVQQASYSEPMSIEPEEQQVGTKGFGRRDREVQTIDLPPSFQRHIQPSAPSAVDVSSTRSLTPIESPVTTEVMDLRNRSSPSTPSRFGQRSGSYGRDIHEGRSMQSIKRGSDLRSRRGVSGIQQELTTEPSADTKNNP
jgi:hypothetical protein